MVRGSVVYRYLTSISSRPSNHDVHFVRAILVRIFIKQHNFLCLCLWRRIQAGSQACECGHGGVVGCGCDDIINNLKGAYDFLGFLTSSCTIYWALIELHCHQDSISVLSPKPMSTVFSSMRLGSPSTAANACGPVIHLVLGYFLLQTLVCDQFSMCESELLNMVLLIEMDP